MSEQISSFEELSNAVEGWNLLVEEINSVLDKKEAPRDIKENLMTVLKELDPSTMDKKRIRSWEKTLPRLIIPEVQDWENKLRAGASYLSEVCDRVAKEATPEMSSWENLRGKIRCRLQK
jgi:hypothetical protein